MTYTIDKIVSVLKVKGYPVNEDDTKPFNLNQVGIRNLTDPKANTFDDTMTVFWKYNGSWTLRVFPCTTDPGNYWLQNPENIHGTAIVKEGHYKDLWHIGMHQGKYKALVQQNPVTVIRDSNRDAVLDFNSVQETGIFGINCHRANENGQSISNDKWSAGCQVLQNRQINNPDNQSVKVFEFDYFMYLCQKKVDNGNGNGFSYSLISSKDFDVKIGSAVASNIVA